MTSINITPTLGSSNDKLYAGSIYACIECSRSQKWQNRRRFKR